MTQVEPAAARPAATSHPDLPPALASHPPIRTFHARRGRVAASTRERVAALRPTLGLPPGPLDAVATFGRRAPLVLEVGSGQGQAALAYAAAHPGHDLVAVDVHTPGIGRLLLGADDAGLTNLRAHEGDALELLAERIGPGQLAAVHLFFPDPWPKARQHKRRFVRPDVVDLVVDRLAPGGALLVATDDPGYAEQARAVLDATSGLVGGPAARPAWRPVAGYEAKALAAGRTVVELRHHRAA